MKKTIFLTLLVSLILSGCGKKEVVKPVDVVPVQNDAAVVSEPTDAMPKVKIHYLEDEKFALTLEPQDAVFYLKTNLTGGPGSTAVVDAKTGQIKMMNNKPIYVESEISKRIGMGLSPYKCIKGNPILRVSANIKLVEQTSLNDSIPGGSSDSFYEAQVQGEKLYEMNIKADPC